MEEKEKKSVEIKAEVIALIAVIVVVVAWPAVLIYFKAISSALGISSGAGSSFVQILKSAVGILVGISFPLSLFFFFGIIYCVERLKQIRHKEGLQHEPNIQPGYETAEVGGNKTLASMWTRVTTHINSANQNDWKQAIIEADLILDDLLTHMGYRGESIGEKLKRVEPSDFNTLNDAWEAHKVRNRIAHEPGFTLNHLEAKQAIHSYKKVFEEFYYV